MYRMKTRVLIFLFMLCYLSLGAQIRLEGYRQTDINPELLTGRWKAHWISMPGEPANVYGVYHMRKTFELDEVPSRFIVHVTADNRYKLYLNGRFVSLGPARGDIYNWNFETVDLAPYLIKGKNVLAAVIWNYAEQKPVAQISFNQTGFLLQGNTEVETVVNTDASWLCMKNEAYAPWHKPVLGYYVAGPGELLSASKYPWGWEQSAYDDSKWLPAHTGIDIGCTNRTHLLGDSFHIQHDLMRQFLQFFIHFSHLRIVGDVDERLRIGHQPPVLLQIRQIAERLHRFERDDQVSLS
jgi:alpha-L-rhamnosidase